MTDDAKLIRHMLRVLEAAAHALEKASYHIDYPLPQGDAERAAENIKRYVADIRRERRARVAAAQEPV